MSARIMTKQCKYCHRTYTYNPSVGDFGNFCKHCMKSQAGGLQTGKPPKAYTPKINMKTFR